MFELTGKSIFNATVCIIGIAIFLIHVTKLLMKKERRRDENALLIFLSFTILHFASYLTFTLIKEVYTSNAFIIAFYTSFYVMNNMEMLLLFYYFVCFANFSSKMEKITLIVNLALFSTFVILDVVNIFTHIFFYAEDGLYQRSPLMILSQGYQFIMFMVIFILTIFHKGFLLREKIAFFLYCVLPLVSIILQNIFAGYAIAYLTIIITVEILVLFLDFEKNIKIREEEKKIKEAYIKIMVSQIRPHFVYNTLSSISTLISIDPKKAQQALDDFTEYLRMNFSTLTDNRLVSFENELKHVETYVSLEKMRFNDRLKVNYDIKAKDFNVPPLSIQPLVENAIKHGILKKLEGGILTVKSYEEEDAYIVEVIDDGVGFDINSIDFSENKHIGLQNIEHRLNTMCKGQMIIDSQVDKGTRIVVKFYK